MNARENNTNRDRIGIVLYGFYLLLLVAAGVILVRIVQIQLFFKPSEKIEAALTPRTERQSIEPARGNILARDGRLLAMSCPQYNIFIKPATLLDKCLFFEEHIGNHQRKFAHQEQFQHFVFVI